MGFSLRLCNHKPAFILRVIIWRSASKELKWRVWKNVKFHAFERRLKRIPLERVLSEHWTLQADIRIKCKGGNHLRYSNSDFMRVSWIKRTTVLWDLNHRERTSFRPKSELKRRSMSFEPVFPTRIRLFRVKNIEQSHKKQKKQRTMGSWESKPNHISKSISSSQRTETSVSRSTGSSQATKTSISSSRSSNSSHPTTSSHSNSRSHHHFQPTRSNVSNTRSDNPAKIDHSGAASSTPMPRLTKRSHTTHTPSTVYPSSSASRSERSKRAPPPKRKLFISRGGGGSLELLVKEKRPRGERETARETQTRLVRKHRWQVISMDVMTSGFGRCRRITEWNLAKTWQKILVQKVGTSMLVPLRWLQRTCSLTHH